MNIAVIDKQTMSDKLTRHHRWLEDYYQWPEMFYNLEKADIPRRYTGKVARAHLDAGGGYINPDTAQKYSDLMRPMTDDQRDTFLALLPQWHGTLDELAEAARNL